MLGDIIPLYIASPTLRNSEAWWYSPSAWTHSSSSVRVLEHSPATARAFHVSHSESNKQNSWLPSDKKLHDRRNKPSSKSLDLRSKRVIYQPLPNVPYLDTSSSHNPKLSARYRHNSLNPLQAPSSPSLPTISPDAPVARQSRPSGIWGDLSDVKFLNTQEFWLALYFVFNLSLTLYNKGVLIKFPYPYTLTAMHALCGAVGGWTLRVQGAFVPKRLSTADNVALMVFSVLYATNIAVSNASLNLVTVPFHQVVRAATPIFTLALSTAMFGTKCSEHKLLSLIPVVVGVGLATYGDYYATVWGLLLTLLGTFLAALKTIFTSVLQSSPARLPRKSCSVLLPPTLSLHPLDLLTRMSPLAFIQCVLYAQMSGELDQVRQWSWHGTSWLKLAGLFFNGCIAFGLNVVSFTANKKVGPLSMTVAANIKQVVTILCAVLLFDLNITLLNAVGIASTLAGGAWYGYVTYDENRRKRELERTLKT